MLNLKDYIMSESFFLDAFLAACLYFCLFYYVPHISKSISRGKIDSNIGSYSLRSKPFAYIFILIANIIMFLVTAIAALAILHSKHNFFRGVWW